MHESVCLRYLDAAYNALIPSLKFEGSAFEPAHLAAVLLLRMVLHNTGGSGTTTLPHSLTFSESILTQHQMQSLQLPNGDATSFSACKSS
jgi:hypothetical protein